jgi:putative ABC transport system permease protein
MSEWHGFVRRHLPPLGIEPTREIEIVDELALQLESAYESAKARGASEEDARAQASVEVPDWAALAATLARIERPTAARPTLGSPRAVGFMSGFIQDLRYGTRALMRSSGFAVVAAATLALGIAAATIVYSLVDGILVRPLPIHEPDRVVLARELTPQGVDMSLSWPNFVDWQARATSFDGVAAWRGIPSNLTGIDTPRRILVRQVTWNLFSVLGVRPLLGRDLTSADEQYGVDRVCLVSYGFWQRELGGDASAIGRRITLDDTPVTVVGVLPADFTVARQEDAFLPFGNFYPPGHFMLARGNHNGIALIARLRADVTLDEARAELAVIARQLAEEYPNTNSGQGATVQPLMEVLVGPVRTTLTILLAAVGVMLLIACVNIANLLLVRGATRAQELEIRLALGAGRWRVVRQLLTESVLLGVLGGAAGVALAYAGFDAALALLPEDQPRLHTVALDGRVLAASGALSIATGLLFGLIPALQAGSRGGAALLRSARVSGAVGARQNTRRALLVAELALAVVLLAGAGLMVRTMGNLLAIDLGFEPSQVLSARVSLPPARYPAAARLDFVSRVEDRLRSLPGVADAAFTISLPVQGSNWNSVFIVEKLPVPPRADLPSAAWTPVTPSYFQTMGIRLLRGRTFEASDRLGVPEVAVVNETFARRFWPNGDALGQRIKQGWPEDQTPWRQIVGIVNDVKTAGVDQPAAMQAYLPMAQVPQTSLTAVVRTQDDAPRLAGPLESAILEVDATLPVYDVRTMDQVIERGVAQQRLLMVLLVGFGGIALVLAALGVFAVTAYSVSQRRHELGVRIALGADRGGVLRLVLRQGLATCAVGIAIGLAAALTVTRVLETLLFEITPYDAPTLAGITAMLLLVAGAACFVPAHRATKVDPVTALRAE